MILGSMYFWILFSRNWIEAMSYIQTIHVIDDDALIRDSLQILLGLEGYLVHSHGSAQAFLNTIEKGDVGCIVTDLNMPGMSGIDLLRRVRDLHICMPAIVISGFMEVWFNQASAEQGAFRSFQKPVDPGVLIAAIHAALVQAYGRDQNPAFSG